MRLIVTFFVGVILSTTIASQVNINIALGGLMNDTIYFGRILGKKQLREKPLIKNSFGTYDFVSDTNMEPGFYAILYDIPSRFGGVDNYYFQIAIDDSNKVFQIYTDGYNPSNQMLITGPHGQETPKYYKYINGLDSIYLKYAYAIEMWQVSQTKEKFDDLSKLEQEMKNFQKSFIDRYKTGLTVDLAKATLMDFPIYTGSLDEQKIQRQNFIDNELLKNFSIKNKVLWSCKNGIDFIDIYTIRTPDGDFTKASQRATKILNGLIEHNPPMYEYYLNYLMNSYLKMTKLNMDQTTVLLSKEFIESGKANFYTREELARFKIQTDNIKKLKVGNKIPDCKLYKEDNTPYNIYQNKSKYTLITFWNPDCGHCKKELPIIKQIAEKYANIGLQIITVCGKRSDKTASCYEYLSQEKFPENWINLNDKNGIAKFNYIYDVTTYPCVYIFNNVTKEILMRRKGDIELLEFENVLNKLL